jgi:hypothetical protein
MFVVKLHVLLDSEIQSNFITEYLAKLLKLPNQTIDIPLKTLKKIETRKNPQFN